MFQWIFSNFFTSLAAFLLGAFVFWSNKKSRVNQVFALYSLAIAEWSFFTAFHALTVSSSASLFAAKMMHVGVPLIPILFFHFCLLILAIYPKHKTKLFIGYAISALLISINFASDLVVLRVRPKLGYHYFMDGGPLYPVVIGTFIIYTIAGLYLIFAAYRTSTGNRKNQLKYLLLGSLLGYSFGASCFLPVYNITVSPYPAGSYAISLYVLITAYAIREYQLLDIRMALTGAGIFSAVYILVLGLPFWIGIATKQWIGAMALMAGFATAGPLIVRFLYRRAERRILANEIRKQEALREFARGLTTIKDTKELLTHLADNAGKILQPEFTALYIYTGDSEVFAAKIVIPPGSNPLPEKLSRHSLTAQARITEHTVHRYTPMPLELLLAIAPADIPHGAFDIPLYNLKSGGIYGFLVLGSPKDKTPYSGRDLDVFEIVSSQASLALETCMYVEDEKKRLTTEAQQRRVEALDHFSSSLAHEINNPITGLLGTLNNAIAALETLAAKLPDQWKSLILAQRNQIQSAFEEAERVANLIIAVRAFGRPEEFVPSVLRMEDVMEFFVTLVTPQAHGNGVKFTHTLEPGLKVEGHKIWLAEAMVNLAINAIHAVKYGKELEIDDDEAEYNAHREKMETEGAVTVKVFRSGPGKLMISVKDNGIGVSKNLKDDIFLDFVTDKASTVGTGMGLARARKIVAMHHGRIWYESEGQYKGAEFFIELPTTDKEPLVKKPKARGQIE